MRYVLGVYERKVEEMSGFLKNDSLIQLAAETIKLTDPDYDFQVSNLRGFRKRPIHGIRCYFDYSRCWFQKDGPRNPIGYSPKDKLFSVHCTREQPRVLKQNRWADCVF